MIKYKGLQAPPVTSYSHMFLAWLLKASVKNCQETNNKVLKTSLNSGFEPDGDQTWDPKDKPNVSLNTTIQHILPIYRDSIHLNFAPAFASRFENVSSWPGVKPQKMREYFSKVGYQVGDLEPCERCHNGVDRHHPSKDLGVYVNSSKITGKVCKHVEYKGVYCYVLGGAEQHQRGPGVRLRGV
ncbi:hypothetical protein DSO57_1003486 [Entomophthora muscae]|uniref:Uncharacterized protein n=1 Tax=Entomophthora muscae TaxID=34485 RepID=A0ACC2RNE2_9FUNG|nr:hypothetical protein DSO57_1003486 [Entomophthora muscae]